MYDVLYLDRRNSPHTVASGLKRDAAVEIARHEASRRRVCRMFLAGSEPRGETVVIVECGAEEQG